jgi:5-(carboxyamino)imidazole ribonucleotide synthase
MINLTGAPGYIGPVKYEGADEVLSIPNTWLHLYGKSVTRPHRKMGHITTIDKTLELVLEKAVEIKKMIKVISQ